MRNNIYIEDDYLVIELGQILEGHTLEIPKNEILRINSVDSETKLNNCLIVNAAEYANIDVAVEFFDGYIKLTFGNSTPKFQIKITNEQLKKIEVKA